ncbi:hypothetical protein RHGRI_035366 [Rhododendron griersonianum]|uniref:Mediator of RNA polymerase II transcription subunit 9 n=1 Tax=Rhododendron griersonianum TaxID=479676 RepID=A0AAV6IA21_9ERIC|nr:hypothetical protein RHGRI_035366 [Rhododendron griersonianum]
MPNLLQLVENLADAIENGTRDQHSDSLVTELTSQFEKCQQLLNSISGSINAKAMTVEGQKRKLEESEQLLNQRKYVTCYLWQMAILRHSKWLLDFADLEEDSFIKYDQFDGLHVCFMDNIHIAI